MTQPLSSHEGLTEQLRGLLFALENSARGYFLRGQLEQALQLLQVGLQVIPLPEVRQRDRATFLLHYGNMLAVKTNFENAPVEAAVLVLEQAKQFATELDDAHLFADALSGIGYARYIAASNNRDGDPQMLLATFQEVLERRRVLHDDRGVSESLFHVGLLSEVLGQKEVARSSYTQALQIARTSGYPREASEALRHLGFLEQTQGNLFQAQQYFTEALHVLEHAEIQVYLPFTHIVIADVCLAQGNMELASSQCQRALELSRRMDIKKALIFSLLTNGHICQEKQEEKQARDSFEQAYTVAQSIDLKHAMQSASSALQHLSGNSST